MNETSESAEAVFDVRTCVCDAEVDEDCEWIQVTYNRVNRMIALIGDIPFKRLFTAQLQDLAETIIPRISLLRKHSLARKPDRIEELCTALVAATPSMTLLDLLGEVRDLLPEGVFDAVLGLRRQSICIPIPERHTEDAARVRSALQGLIDEAPDITYKDLYTKPSDSVSQEIKHALMEAHEAGILDKDGNDRCCAGPLDPASRCDPRTGKTCYLAPPTYEHCTIGSFDC
ncbi:MAG TPA: hypothetical protein VGM37_21240 [Armatimonadota bacterium]